MADEESQEISSAGGDSERGDDSRKPVVPADASDDAVAVEADPEKFNSLKKNAEEICVRLDNIHKFMLDLGNYYFAFQGVCLAAISNTSFFVCNNAWFLTFLSILSAIPSLAALGFLAHEWIDLMNQLDAYLKDMDVIKNVAEKYVGGFNLPSRYYSVLSGYEYSFLARWMLLAVGVLIIICFTAMVAAWPHVMICKNNGRPVFDKGGFN